MAEEKLPASFVPDAPGTPDSFVPDAEQPPASFVPDDLLRDAVANEKEKAGIAHFASKMYTPFRGARAIGVTGGRLAQAGLTDPFSVAFKVATQGPGKVASDIGTALERGAQATNPGFKAENAVEAVAGTGAELAAQLPFFLALEAPFAGLAGLLGLGRASTAAIKAGGSVAPLAAFEQLAEEGEAKPLSVAATTVFAALTAGVGSKIASAWEGATLSSPKVAKELDNLFKPGEVFTGSGKEVAAQIGEKTGAAESILQGEREAVADELTRRVNKLKKLRNKIKSQKPTGKRADRMNKEAEQLQGEAASLSDNIQNIDTQIAGLQGARTELGQIAGKKVEPGGFEPPVQSPPPVIQTESGPVVNPLPAVAQAVEGTEKVVAEFGKKLPKLAQPIENVVRAKPNIPISELMAELIETGQLSAEEGIRLLVGEVGGVDAAKTLGGKITRQAAAKSWRETSSLFGRGLNRLSQAKKLLQKQFGNNPEVNKLLDQALEGEEVPEALALRSVRWLNDKLGQGVDIIRANWLSQFGGAARDFLSQGGRVGVELFTDAMSGTFRYLSGRESRRAAFANMSEGWHAFMGALSKEDTAVFRNIIDDKKFSAQKAVLLSNPLADLTKLDRYTQVLTYFRRKQELLWRKVGFMSRFNSILTRLGINREGFALLPLRQQKAIVMDAADHGLTMTFANSPKDAFFKAYLSVYKKFPLLHLFGQAFPKFWWNAMKFNYEFSPINFVAANADAIATKSGLAAGQFSAKNAQVAFEGMAKGTTGMVMFGTALGIQTSKFKGDKWYQVRPLPDSKPDFQVDTRNFAPLISTSLFTAEILKRKYEVMFGDRESMGFSPGEITSALFAMRRTDLSGIAFLDNFIFNKRELTEGADSMMEKLSRLAGDWIGALSTPLKNLRDIPFDKLVQGKFDSLLDDQAIKDTSMHPVTGQFIANIPGARESLPDFPDVTQPGARKRAAVGLRQLSGITINRSTAARRLLARHNITEGQFRARTSNAELNNKINVKIGEGFAEAARDAVQSGKYELAETDFDRTDVLLKALRKLKSRASRQVRADNPKLDLLERAKRAKGAKKRQLEQRIKDDF